MKELQGWLNEQCNIRNWSWREASIKANINPGAISAIMNGQRPGLQICLALASLFGYPPDTVLRMAGYLPPGEDVYKLPPVYRARLDELRRIWEHLRDLDAETAEKLSVLLVNQAELVLATAQRARDTALDLGDN